eukprot:10532029-Alexandrium_andersonii.AAC.1
MLDSPWAEDIIADLTRVVRAATTWQRALIAFQMSVREIHRRAQKETDRLVAAKRARFRGRLCSKSR